MYLDKPLRDHTLLQAICRVNRTYSELKTHGLIVDYLGIFDDVASAWSSTTRAWPRWCRTSRNSRIGYRKRCRSVWPSLPASIAAWKATRA
jgi:hypothetical protein